MKNHSLLKKILWRKAEKTSEIPPKADWNDLTRRGWQVIDQSPAKIAFADLEGCLRTGFSLHFRHPRRFHPSVQRAEIDAVITHKRLASVFMHHGDGWVREAALRQLDGPLSHPAEVYTCVVRLNDWVPSVKEAAQDAIDRCFSKTSVDIILPALIELLPRFVWWKRLERDAWARLDDLLERRDVFEGLVSHLLRTSKGGTSLIFRELSRNPALDARLEALAFHAPLPNIRAFAIEAILTGQTKFPERRREKQWIDRRFNAFVWHFIYAKRDITGPFDIPRILEIGAMDRTAMVRRSIADYLIAQRNDVNQRALLDGIADHLRKDKRASIQSRIAFYDRMKDQDL